MFSMFDANIANDGTPIAMAIEQATDPMLMHADWSKNLDICDMINEAGEGQISATKMLRKQLRSENSKTVTLALELTDACVKNCNTRLHMAVANKVFLGDIVVLAEGKRGVVLGDKNFQIRDQALNLIQQWHISFQEKRDDIPGFHEAYASLKTRGLPFPEVEQSAPVFTPPREEVAPPAPTPSSPSPGISQEGEKASDDLSKLKDDLGALREKIMLCREMLPESPGIEHDETLAEVIGFLEACQPRMVDLVEAGMMGMLDEELLSIALQVNDDLIKTLDAEKNGTPLPAETSSSGGNGGGGGGSLLDLESSEPAPSANDDDTELEVRKKGKNRQRSRSPPNSSNVSASAAAANEQDIFSSLSTPEVIPAPSAGRFEEPSPVDPFASMSAPVTAPTGDFDNLSIFDTPSASVSVVPAPVDAFDAFNAQPTNAFDQAVPAITPPAAPATEAPSAYNPFDFDESSSYLAPSSAQVVSEGNASNPDGDNFTNLPAPPAGTIPVLRAPSNPNVDDSTN